jgi:hypothetical protein
MHLFTALGFNTGYSLDECVWHLKRSKCDGGIEHSIGTKLFNKSDIVKNPEWFYKPELLNFDIDYIIVPVRSLKDVALSRERNNGYGGFWQGATNLKEQAEIDYKAIDNFMQHIIDKRLTVVFLDFPRIIKDVDYLFDKLMLSRRLLFDRCQLKRLFNEIANPEKVHV